MTGTAAIYSVVMFKIVVLQDPISFVGDYKLTVIYSKNFVIAQQKVLVIVLKAF